MKIVLSHDTALEYWRNASTFPLPRPQASRACIPGEAVPADEISLLRDRFSLSSPVHLLVQKPAKQPQTKDAIYHMRADRLPSGSLAVIENGLFVTSPGLLMAQKARDLDIIELTFLGNELCGTYSVINASTGKHYGQIPESGADQLEAYLNRADGLHGVKKARRAMQYVLPNSASPAESALAMSFTLPNLLGGASLSKPLLNHRIDPGKSARRNVSQNYYKCDLYWEKARLAVEYDSNLCHTGAHRIAKDSRRRDELAGLGITVVTITTGQFSNFQQFNKLVNTIAKLLGERIRPRNKNFATRQIQLHSHLWSLLSQRPSEPRSPSE